MKVLPALYLLEILSNSSRFFNNFTLCTALDTLVEKRITGFPVVDDDWKLVMFYIFCLIIFCVEEQLHSSAAVCSQ